MSMRRVRDSVSSPVRMESLESRQLLAGAIGGEAGSMRFPNEFVPAVSAPSARFEGYNVVVGDCLYAMGGFDPNFKIVPNIDIYNANTNTWSTIKADLPAAETHAGVAVDGSSIYFTGGFLGALGPGRQQEITRMSYRYDTATNTWDSFAPLPSPRGGGAMVKAGRYLHYFGGVLGDRVTNSGTHWMLYLGRSSGGADDSTTWVRRPMMPSPRDHFSAVDYEGLIYAIGGEYGHDELHSHSKLVHSFDPATGVWKRLADLPEVRSHAEAATFAYGGRIYFGGGQFGEYESAADVFEYDIAGNSWNAVKSLPEARQGGAMLKIGSLVVIALGGAETDDPRRDTWVGKFRS